MVPDFLCHYYEQADGSFRNLSDLPLEEAQAVLERIRMQGDRFASQRRDDYLTVRFDLEDQVRRLFITKGGEPKRLHPHYFVLGECTWLKSWYPQGRELRIPLRVFHAKNISFTYGDTFPAMRYRDGKPYRGIVYTLGELPGVVEQYGLPQVWNIDGKGGPERYIEAQVWDDEPLQEYRNLVRTRSHRKVSAAES
jgi:hypothetical protein